MNVKRMIRVTLGVCAMTVTIAAASGCADTRGRLYVRIGPPAPIVETRLVAPGPGYVWIDGYQRWDGARYVWESGRWAQPPRARARWVTGRWARDNHGWYYVQGHWR